MPTELLGRYGKATAVTALAGTKRRLYRTFLSWAENYNLCGGLGDAVVDRVLQDLKARYLWLPPEHRPGQVTTIGGQRVPIGPLDATGIWVPDPNRPSEGQVRFAAEVKNTRSILYPYHHEVWDLLAKLVEFPSVVPVLVARRIHYTTFVFFGRIGALGIKTHQQWFSPTIDPDRFSQVTAGLSFRDAVQLDPAKSPPGLLKWFRETGPAQATGALPKWAIAAPILSAYTELRDPDLDPTARQGLWRQLVEELRDAGIVPPLPEDEEAEDEPPEWGYDDD